MKETRKTPTTPSLIIRVIGHKVSSVEIGREHERNIHNPMNDGLGLRSKLDSRLEIKRIIQVVISGGIT